MSATIATNPRVPTGEYPAEQTAAKPVSSKERIASIDVLRGFALLGILVLNIDSFGNPELVHDIPVGTPIPNFIGPNVHLNLALLFLKWMFFEGKMRGIFSMLFGAGLILMTQRAEKRGQSDIADVYARRNLILMVTGILHTCFIWIGDILFDYGMQALLFLYPCRKLKARTLLWLGTFLSLVVAPVGGFLFLGAMHDVTLHGEMAKIAQQQRAGQPISDAQRQMEKVWQARVDENRITNAKTQDAVKEATLGYWDSVLDRAKASFQQTFYITHIDLLADNVSAMLIGMGLMKLGFFTAELPYATYLWTALVGFGISLPLYAAGVYKAYASGFFFYDVDNWLFAPYYLGREAGSLAIAAVIMLIVKRGLLLSLQRPLAAVGRTALSNYLLTSILCQAIFIWDPWKLFGKLEYYQLMYVVFGVWAFNLIASTLWLRKFLYGPFEWVWRSLTYAKVQPLRIPT